MNVNQMLVDKQLRDRLQAHAGDQRWREFAMEILEAACTYLEEKS